MFSAAEERPQLLIVRAGTPDDPSSVKPSAAIWRASAPAWAHIGPDLPYFEGQPPAPAVTKPG